ncbi:hypothetical protein AB6A40_006929 [Gnathostoma spinigerum]|uniref:Prismalin-14 n=1 Tax=Gnathostoma spinigerum TaxID=75299 RepID=A0ABD6EVF2_9BILA
MFCVWCNNHNDQHFSRICSVLATEGQLFFDTKRMLASLHFSIFFVLFGVLSQTLCAPTKSERTNRLKRYYSYYGFPSYGDYLRSYYDGLAFGYPGYYGGYGGYYDPGYINYVNNYYMSLRYAYPGYYSYYRYGSLGGLFYGLQVAQRAIDMAGFLADIL